METKERIKKQLRRELGDDLGGVFSGFVVLEDDKRAAALAALNQIQQIFFEAGLFPAPKPEEEAKIMAEAREEYIKLEEK